MIDIATNKDDLLYRPCVGIALLNTKGDIFVGERIDTPGAWQMPQGGIDPGETIEQAALRELLEEVGTNKVDVVRIFDRKLRYDLPDELINTLWNGKYRGQEQTWVALRFMGDDEDINLCAFDPPEFSNWQWVALRETLDLIVPFKRGLYAELIGMLEELDEFQ